MSAIDRQLLQSTQAHLDTLLRHREVGIKMIVKPEVLAVVGDRPLLTMQLKYKHLEPDGVDACFQGIADNCDSLIIAQWNIYFHQTLKVPVMNQLGCKRVAAENDAIASRYLQALEIFKKKFIAGQANLNDLPLPEQPTFVPEQYELSQPLPKRHNDCIKRIFRQQTQKHAAVVDEKCQQSTIIANIGGLLQQLKFCVFVQNNLPEGQRFEDVDLQKWATRFLQHEKDELQELEKQERDLNILNGIREALSQPSPVEEVAKVAKTKKKKKKKRAPVAAVAPQKQSPPVVRPQLKPHPRVPSQESIDLNLRLNRFEDLNGCMPHLRLQRWGAISLAHSESVVKIKNFIDFDGNDQPKRIYAKYTLEELRQQKANHDIPIHTIMREKALLSRYSFHHTYTNHRDMQRDTRVFCAEKLSRDEEGNLCSELGLINAAMDDQGVIYHCLFKKTKDVKLSEVTREYAEPEALGPADEKEEEGAFEFKGNYHIEIDPKDEAIVIKIGQDKDPHQVIYRIRPLKN